MVLKDIQVIKKMIKKSKKIFLIAHKDLDLDAISSCIAMSHLLKKINKESYIIIDDTTNELGVEKILREIDGCYNIITSKELEENLCKKKKKNLLVVLDTNKKDLLQNKDVLELFERTLVIDHHELGKNSIYDAYQVIYPECSSASQMVVQILNEYKIDITPYLATILLSGIVLDTNNFTLNTNEETFYSAYYLTVFGASNKKVQYLLKQDIDNYVEQQKLLTNIEIIDDKIAIAKGTPHSVYRREDLARIAETLLLFDNIELSLVIGKINKEDVGVSARSFGNIDVEVLLTKLGGGGNKQYGAALFENKKISEVVEKVKKELKTVEDKNASNI
jgi:c-di-AMP phosphodiesterase-like protein